MIEIVVCFSVRFMKYVLPIMFNSFQVTGGSLEESKEALAIAETDGHLI